MRLQVTSLDEPLTEGSAEALPVSDAAPVVLSLELLDDELLDVASLVLRRAAPGPGPTVVASDTSANGSLTGVQWVMATWDRAQPVEALSLAFASKPNPLLVRVRIAQGGSGWYLPPGPHTFTLGAAMQLHATLPDTVAERVLVEFLDLQGAAVTVDLSALDPLSVQLGREPRDLDLRVSGRRPFLRWSGAIPQGAGIAVNDLRSRLDTELGSPARGRTVVLELRAAVAGELALEWSFGSVSISESFPDGAPTRTTSIPWGSSVDELLLLAEPDGVSIETLALSVAATPVAERLVLALADGTTSSRGQLVRPLYEAAQAIPLERAWSLSGVDILARTLAVGTSITLGLHPDSNGRPAAGAIVELHRVIDAPMSEPAWIAFDATTPLPAAAGVWWLVLRVDEGELVWLGASSPGSGGLLHRRDRDAWLTRAGQHAVVRARAAGAPSEQPLSLWLRGVEAGGPAAAWEAPLSLAEDGTIRWSAGMPAPPPSSALSLRIAAEVAATVVLSNLELRYRASAP